MPIPSALTISAVIQNVYIRKVEKKDGSLYNIEFATVPNVKDPVKAARQ